MRVSLGYKTESCGTQYRNSNANTEWVENLKTNEKECLEKM
jgi:hypothetical protein